MNQRYLNRVALAGAALQVVYGLLACVFPYPRITDPPFELVWALANVGMIANIAAWLSLGVARPRWLAAFGGGLAILGHLVRIVVSGVIIARPHATVDTAVVSTIGGMFIGIALLGIATLRGKRMTGWSAWAPLLVLAGGLVAAPFYSFDKVVHFILLGLLWGSAWLFMAWTGYRTAVAGSRSPVPVGEPLLDDAGRI
ncbi:MAG TPA: hypothetical protein VGJ28_22445 [Micromonosporaceae bacterium]